MAATVEDVDNALVQWQENSDRGIDLGIDKRERPGTKARARCSFTTAAPASPTAAR